MARDADVNAQPHSDQGANEIMGAHRHVIRTTTKTQRIKDRLLVLGLIEQR